MIVLDVISPRDMRYKTLGDWEDYSRTRVTRITVPYMGDWRNEFAVLVHELVEWALCRQHGISDEEVTKWDKAHPRSDDPAALPGCPYRDEHKTAEMIEKIVLEALDMTWEEHIEVQERIWNAWP